VSKKGKKVLLYFSFFHIKEKDLILAHVEGAVFSVFGVLHLVPCSWYAMLHCLLLLLLSFTCSLVLVLVVAVVLLILFLVVLYQCWLSVLKPSSRSNLLM